MFRWFIGLEMDDRVWAPTVFTKNRDRLLQGEIAQAFFEAVLEQARLTQVTGRSSAIDGRTVRHEGYPLSQRKRKRVEEVFGWMKTIGRMFGFTAAAYNLVRMRNLWAPT